MEFLILPIILVAVVGALFPFYLADKAGWNALAKRVSKTVRANLEWKRDPNKDKMLPMLTSSEWEEQFEGKKAIETAATVRKKHYITKTDFYKAGTEDWPRWRCACGYSDYTPVIYTGFGDAIKTANRNAEGHVRDANRNEEIKDQYRLKGIRGREW